MRVVGWYGLRVGDKFRMTEVGRWWLVVDIADDGQPILGWRLDEHGSGVWPPTSETSGEVGLGPGFKPFEIVRAPD